MSASERKSQMKKALMGLRSLVMTGDVQAGERLSEVAVAERLGISRTPLREAMSQLIDEGLLERVPTGGCRVRTLHFADIVDAIEFRGVVEGTAARLAAERGAPGEAMRACRQVLDQIDTSLGQHEADTDFDLYADLNDQFHSQMAHLCRSETIQREFERVACLPLAGPSAFLQAQAAMPSVRRSLIVAQAQHRGILEAIEAREGARAEALAREHARLARQNLDAVLHTRTEVRDSIPGLSLVTDMPPAGRTG